MRTKAALVNVIGSTFAFLISGVGLLHHLFFVDEVLTSTIIAYILFGALVAVSSIYSILLLFRATKGKVIATVSLSFSTLAIIVIALVAGVGMNLNDSTKTLPIFEDAYFIIALVFFAIPNIVGDAILLSTNGQPFPKPVVSAKH